MGMQQKSELPEGWVETTLERILSSLESGSRPKGGVRGILEGIPSIGGEHLNDNGGFRFDKIKFVAEEFFEKMSQGIIKVNDILVVKDGATTGKVSIVKTDFPYDRAAVNEHVFLCRPYSELSSDYIFYFLFSEIGQKRILNNFRGSAQGGINKSFAPNTMIPLPPLPEQHRIVLAIEALFTRLDATNEKLDRVQEILKKFRESVLAAACDGRLTKEWRKENLSVKNPDDYLKEINEIRIKCSKKDELKFKTISELDICDLSELPDSWLWIPSNVIFSYVTSGSRGWAKYYSDTGSIFLRIGNLDRSSIYLRLEDIQRVTLPDNAEGRRTRIQKNDVLISITADIGSIGYICEELGDAYINQHIALARPVQNLNPKYIAYFLHSQTGGKKQFEKLHRGATKIGLGLDDIRSIAIPLPPLLEQQEIVRRVDTLFAFADSIEAKVTAAREKMEKLRQSIPAKAFSGELVETEAEIARREGRDYETAEVLIERIKEERGKGGKKR
jgi:type I restriction enzyme S subunit